MRQGEVRPCARGGTSVPRMSLEPGDTLQVSNIVSLINAHAGGRQFSPLYIEGSDQSPTHNN